MTYDESLSLIGKGFLSWEVNAQSTAIIIFL